MTDVWTDGWLMEIRYGRIWLMEDGMDRMWRTDGWTDGWMDGCIDGGGAERRIRGRKDWMPKWMNMDMTMIWT